MRRAQLLLAVFFALLALVVISIAVEDRGPGQPERTMSEIYRKEIEVEMSGKALEREKAEKQTMAFVIAKNFVKDKLKAPATAEFPWFDFTSSHEGAGVYRVESYVDAQNSFGAMLRSRWKAKLRYKSGCVGPA